MRSLVLGGILLYLGCLRLSAEGLTLGVVEGIDPTTKRWVQLIVEDLSTRTGIPIQIKHLPPARQTLMMKSGKIDGEMGRVGPYIEVIPSLHLVPTSFLTLSIAVITSDDRTIESLAELKKDHHVIYNRGHYLSKVLVKKINPKDVTVVDNFEQGCRMLNAGRASAFVTADLMFKAFQTQGAKFTEGLHIGLIARSEPVYLFLAPKHEDLVNSFDQAIKEMHEEDLFAKLKQKVIRLQREERNRSQMTKPLE